MTPARESGTGYHIRHMRWVPSFLVPETGGSNMERPWGEESLALRGALPTLWAEGYSGKGGGPGVSAATRKHGVKGHRGRSAVAGRPETQSPQGPGKGEADLWLCREGSREH